MPINPELRRLELQDEEFQASLGERRYESCRIEDTIGLELGGGGPSVMFKHGYSWWFRSGEGFQTSPRGVHDNV